MTDPCVHRIAAFRDLHRAAAEALRAMPLAATDMGRLARLTAIARHEGAADALDVVSGKARAVDRPPG